MQTAVTGNVQEGAGKMIFTQDHLSISPGDVPKMLVQSREGARTPESAVQLLESSSLQRNAQSSAVDPEPF